jgi:predicted kinase
MDKQALIIVLGPPAAGKTTLAHYLSKEIGIPAFGKDEIKERIFDTVGWSDKEWNKKVTGAGYSILYFFLDLILSNGGSMIVESNFSGKRDTKRFQELQKKHDFKVIQILCQTEGDVLVERFKKRSKAGLRHPGHTDNLNYREFNYEHAKAEALPLELDGPILKFDTTNLAEINYSHLFQKVKEHLS